MLNKVSDGKTARYAAAANVKGGSIVKVGDRLGVATQDIASGATGLLDMTGGVYQFNTSNAIGVATAGAPIYAPTLPNDGGTLAATSASGAVKVGQLEEATVSGQKLIDVRLA